MTSVFRRAEESDLPAILTIISQAQAYLKACGVDQWQDGYPSEQVMRGDMADGTGYVLERGGLVVGIATIVLTGEPTYDVITDGAWASSAPFACIHRIALSSGLRGTGASGELMREAERLIHARGMRYVRIDTHHDNLTMQRMLHKNGYTARGTIYLENGSPRIAMDKTLA